jgi:hypothetical protein
MDEEEMDVIDRGEKIDLDGDAAMPERARHREEMRRRAQERMDEMQRQMVQVPMRVLTETMGILPVQTREHLRQSAREGVLAMQSVADAIGSAGVMAIDRLFADPRTPKETAQPRRIVIERDETTSSD